jgi:hypothetical protein
LLKNYVGVIGVWNETPTKYNYSLYLSEPVRSSIVDQNTLVAGRCLPGRCHDTPERKRFSSFGERGLIVLTA